MSTIKQIAEIAGVSRGTVDRVLNNRGGVNGETEKRILMISSSLNYSPSKAGQNLAIRKKNIKFGCILFSSSSANPFFESVEEGIRSKAVELNEYGVFVDVQYSDFDNWQKQIDLLDFFMGNNYNGIAITPVNDPRVAEKLKELAENGIPIVTDNSDILNSGRIAYVGSNYRLAGRTAAGLFNLFCSRGANVGIVTGSPNILCHTERIAGLTECINEAFPNLRIKDTAVNHDDDIESYIETKKMLDVNSDINALFLVAAGVQGACKAAIESGRKMTIISYDCVPSTKKLISDGIISATIDQQPHYQGRMPLEILFNFITTGLKPEQEFFYTNVVIKIKENL